MDPEAVSQVRRFNRVVTQRVGALDDRFLSRDRPHMRLGVAPHVQAVGLGNVEARAPMIVPPGEGFLLPR
jgi:hypothetical protein